MVAVAAEPDPQRPHQTVIEEIAAGYLRDDELLRAAQVKVTLNKENP
jgi:molecular chaperone GrpE (heat shock protein)